MPRSRAVPSTVLVYGLAVTGAAVARQLLTRGHHVVLVDDRHDPAAAVAAGLGLDLVEAPSEGRLAALVDGADVIVPTPGLPIHHPVYAIASRAGVPVWSEFELAARWSDIPIVAITGTNGKTTVTNLVTDMLRRAGRRTVGAGNTDVPLVDVLDQELDVIVAEASSFRLQFTESFKPIVATWLNLAEDHLDWHSSMDDYVAAKARIWANLGPADVPVANADDATVADIARGLDHDVSWFSVAEGEAPWHWDRGGGWLVGPEGPFVRTDALPRRLPHDLANALAATATAVAAGATTDVCADVLTGFAGFAHRVARIADVDGVSWYDDSKATTPASVVTAVGGFDSVVLIAGGRNKGLDLSVLGSLAPPVRAVVAIGDAAPEVRAAFAASGVRVAVAANMREAVDEAADAARPGDTVLLSPGCASFDWYVDYTERGDDFTRLVLERPGAEPAPALPNGGH